MNNDLISRDKLLEAFRDFKDIDCPSGHTVTADYMIELAEDAPAVDAAPVRRGEWLIENIVIDNNGRTMPGWPRCSECKKQSDLEYDYCPNCGAKMMDGDK